jgi:DNA-binding NtrC family response regulator
MSEKILVVDDEIDMLQALNRFLSQKGYAVATANDGPSAVKAMEETQFDLVISDLAMQGMSGIDLLRWVRSSDANMPFIIMTGVGTIESAVEAIQTGAYNYIAKPFKLQDVEILVKRAIEYSSMHRKLAYLQILEDQEKPEMIFGSSKAMQKILKRISKISNSDASVLIQGETGTGKSMLARLIHDNSDRVEEPFLTIDCGALAETILESELFGHVKGAFTHAVNAKRGLLEEAQGGTIFLDEIGDISLSTQMKLLRAIQEKEIKPVGGNRSVSIDVRFVSATSAVLEEKVKENTFRKELYYRLAVVPIYTPPLRERREDFPLLIDHFLKKFCKRYRKTITHIKPEVLQILYDSEWKGNIRELANMMERSVLLSENNTISLDCLCHDGLMPQTLIDSGQQALSLKNVVEGAEKKAIEDALATTDNNRSQAAKLLGISRRTLYDKLELYGMKTSS